ncbi:MAG: hypothetical protein ABI042_01935 [Verrucomicrobiota bacterium]
MPLKPEKYLINASKRYEFVVGLTCALISLASTSLLVWIVYLVAWRNPRVYGVNDLFKVSTLAMFLLFFLISLGFSVLAFRLLSPNQNKRQLFFPLLLRLWGAFFASAGFFLLAVSLIKGDWEKVTVALEMVPFSVTMAVAAFLLARKIRREDNNPESRN